MKTRIKTMCQWKLLSGVHSDSNAKMVTPADPELLKGIVREPGDGIFYPGDVFDSDADLDRHNYPDNLRFEKLGEANADGLQDMTEKGLYEFAASEDINLPPAMSRDELIKAIRGAVDYRSVTQQNIASPTFQTSPDDGDGLDKMNVKQLRAHAKDNEVDLDDTMSKPDIVEAIRGAGALA